MDIVAAGLLRTGYEALTVQKIGAPGSRFETPIRNKVERQVNRAYQAARNALRDRLEGSPGGPEEISPFVRDREALRQRNAAYAARRNRSRSRFVWALPTRAVSTSSAFRRKWLPAIRRKPKRRTKRRS